MNIKNSMQEFAEFFPSKSKKLITYTGVWISYKLFPLLPLLGIHNESGS